MFTTVDINKGVKIMQETALNITDAEWEVMRTVWANESITSKEVIRILGDKKEWKPGTIKTLLARLVDKGALKTEQLERKYIYTAAVTEGESINTYTEDILSRVCNKQSGKVIINMIMDATLSKADIAAMKEILEEKETTAADEVPCECAAGQCECHLH